MGLWIRTRLGLEQDWNRTGMGLQVKTRLALVKSNRTAMGLWVRTRLGFGIELEWDCGLGLDQDWNKTGTKLEHYDL